MPGQQAGHAFFRHVRAQGKRASFLGAMLRSLDSGLYAVPKSMRALSRFPMEERWPRNGSAPQLCLPQQKLIKQFYAKHPEAREQPVALNSTQPSLAKRFVQRQMEVMQEGLTGISLKQGKRSRQAVEAASFALIAKKMLPELAQLQRKEQSPALAGHLHLIQQEEEKQLKEAMEAAALRVLSSPAPNSSSTSSAL